MTRWKIPGADDTPYGSRLYVTRSRGLDRNEFMTVRVQLNLLIGVTHVGLCVRATFPQLGV